MPRAQHTADVPKMSLKPNVSTEQCAGRARTTARLLGRGCARHRAQPRPLRAQVTELDVGERQGRDSNPSHRTPSPLSPPAKRVCEGRANLSTAPRSPGPEPWGAPAWGPGRLQGPPVRSQACAGQFRVPSHPLPARASADVAVASTWRHRPPGRGAAPWAASASPNHPQRSLASSPAGRAAGSLRGHRRLHPVSRPTSPEDTARRPDPAVRPSL